MAKILNCVSFDIGIISDEIASSGSVSFSSSIKRTGAGSLRTLGVGQVSLSTISATGAGITNFYDQTVYHRFYFYCAVLPSSGTEQICTIVGGVNEHLRIDSAGNIEFRDSSLNVPVGGIAYSGIKTGKWHRIELATTFGTGLQPFTIRVYSVSDASLLAEASGVRTTGTYFQTLQLGCVQLRNGNSNIEFHYDDVAISADTWIGRGAVKLAAPISNGSVAQWTEGTGSSDWNEVKDTPVNYSKFIKCKAIPNQEHLVRFQSVSTLGINGKINGVVVFTRNTQDLSGLGTVKVVLKSGATRVENDQSYAGGAISNIQRLSIPVDPNTAADWTNGNFDLIEAGVSNKQSGRAANVEAIFLYVEHETPINPVISAQDGPYESPSTWTNGEVPTEFDIVSIGHTVTYTDARKVKSVTITGNGKLKGSGPTAIMDCLGNFVNSSSSTVAGFELENGAEFWFANTGLTFTEPSKYAGAVPGIKIVGNSTNRCKFGTRSGGTNAYITGSGTYSGLVDIEYCNITRLGSSGTRAITASIDSDGSDALASKFRIANCVIDSCGEIGNNAGNVGAYAKFSITNTTFKNSLATTNNIDFGFYNAKAGSLSTRDIKFCVFDKQASLRAPRDITVEDNVFNAGFAVTTTDATGWASWARNFVQLNSSVNQLNIFGSVTDDYWFYNHSVATNPRYMNAGFYGGVTYNISGVIFDGNFTDATGDCILLASPASAATVNISNCIFMPNAADECCGTPFSALGNANVTISFNHNTAFVGSQGCAVGDTYAGHTGMISSFKSNIFFDNSPRGFKLFDSGADNAVTDLVSAANANYNVGYNLSTSGGAKGYGAAPSGTDLEFSTGSPGANDITQNPSFIDFNKDLAAWDTFLGGPGTAANAILELSKLNDVGFNSNYTVTNLRNYVHSGWRPTNQNLATSAHDGTFMGALNTITDSPSASPSISRSISPSASISRSSSISPSISRSPSPSSSPSASGSPSVSPSASASRSASASFSASPSISPSASVSPSSSLSISPSSSLSRSASASLSPSSSLSISPSSSLSPSSSISRSPSASASRSISASASASRSVSPSSSGSASPSPSSSLSPSASISPSSSLSPSSSISASISPSSSVSPSLSESSSVSSSNSSSPSPSNPNVSAETIIVNSSTGSGFSATVNIGAITNYPGYYADNRNLISELQVRLHDNVYYQRHSYEIESPVGIENYSAQVLDAIHPAGRRLFGRLKVEDVIDYQKTDSIFGFINANLYAENEAHHSSVPYENVGNALIITEPIQALGLSSEELNFLAMRVFYPHEYSTSDMQFTGDFYDGEFTYSSDSLNYIGGLSNTSALTISNGRPELMPDPVLYRFSFDKAKAKLWITGSSKTRQESESVYLEGGIDDSKLKIDHSSIFRVAGNSFSVKIEFRPEEAVDKALVAKSGSGFYSSGTDDQLWGGSGTSWPSTLTSRSWGIGFSASRQVYVNIFDSSDNNPPSDGKNTYTHTSVLALDEYHSVGFSYNHITSTVSITVDGITESFSHTGEINDSITPITIGSTFHVSPAGKSLTFLGGLRNLGIWNRVVSPTDFAVIEHKNYHSLKAHQRHGLLMFSNLNHPFPVDETGYNNVIKHFRAEGDPITQCFDKRDNISYSQTAKYNIQDIEDITFWRGIGLKATSCFAPSVYQCSGTKQENLIFASTNLFTSFWLNITPEYKSDRVVMWLNDLGGSFAEFDLQPDLHLVEDGEYILEFEIQNDIRNEFGHVKGFRIYFNEINIAELYKIGLNYTSNNVTYSITPDGNWIHCRCTLNLVGLDPNFKFTIRMLSTDANFAWDTFTPFPGSSIAIRNFHLHREDIEDSTYIETKNAPIVNGRLPSIMFGNHVDGYEFTTDKLNIENKIIFCVCSATGVIIDGQDFILNTNEFITNVTTANIVNVTLTQNYPYKRKLIRASHIDGVIEIYRKVKGVAPEISSDIQVIDPPASGIQTYKLFSNCENLKVYELIVLEDLTDYEIDATTQHLIEKYDLE